MKNLASLAMMIGAAALLGCGGGGGDDPDARVVVFVDASPGGTPDAAGGGNPDAAPLACNPVSQSGCTAGEKCTSVPVDDQGNEGVQCAMAGTVQLGADCMEPDMVGGTDDCIAGAYCYTGKCRQLCSTDVPNSCNTGTACVPFNGLEIDLCLPNCDPLTQDCEDTGGGNPQGCYLTGTGPVCAPVVGGEGAPAGGACQFLNDCAKGGGCFDDGMGGGVCLAYCDFATNPGTGDPNCKPAEVCGGIQDEELYGVCVEDTGE